MKRALLLLFTFVITVTATAQIDKGNFLLGVNASFKKNNWNTEYRDSTGSTLAGKHTTLSVNFNGGYFLLNKLAVGARLNLNQSKSESTWNPGKEGDRKVTWGPFARYYFLPRHEKINLFADAGYYFEYETYNNSQDEDSNNGYTIAAGPAFFIHPAVALEFSIGYSRRLSSPPGMKAYSVQSALGLQVHLGKNKVK